MLQFDDVSLSFAGEPLFEGASFTLQKGERCGLLGRNGSGKSTLFRLINGELEPDKGSVSIPKNYQIGYLQQHIHFTEPSLIQEAALGLPPQEKDHLYKAEKILFGLGFTKENLHEDPTSFSGGFQLRLHLAKVLIANPNCLLLDEPTNYLDILSIRWLTQFLQRWPGELILITHDREVMDKITTHSMAIHRQKVKKLKGSSLDLFSQILVEEEIHEKTRIKTEKRRSHLQSFIDRFSAKATKAGQAEARKKMIAREPVLEKLNDLSELSFSFHEAPFPGKKMTEIKSIAFSYTEDPLIENVSFSLERGERIAIIGKNGRGKSTLLRLVARELTPKKGSVVTSVNTQIGYFGQTHIDHLNKNHTIEQEIGLANSTLSYAQIKSIAGLMMFSGDLSQKKISVLSGGERSRVLLAKIIACPCNLLLLDEPTHHLDIESIEALIDALEIFSHGIIIVTHSELLLRRLNLDKIVICEDGKQTHFLGTYDEFLEKLGWEEEKKPKKAPSMSRHEKAQQVVERAASLKPLLKEIQTTETKIFALEEAEKEYERAVTLNEATTEDHKTAKLRRQELETLETLFYTLAEELEKRKNTS